MFKRHAAFAATGTALALAGAVLLLGGVPFRRPAPSTGNLPIVRDGVTLAQVGPGGVGSGVAVKATEGDFLLESAELRLVIGGDGVGAERELRRGAMIDLAIQDFAEDELVDLRTVAEVMGGDLGLRMSGVVAVTDGLRPLVRVKQQSRDGRLALETDIALTPGAAVAELVTRATNTSSQPIHGLRFGDRARWPGAHTFAPRLGFVKFATRATAPFLARRGRDMSYVLAFPDGPADVAFHFDRVGPTGQIALAPAADLAPGATREHRRTLAVVPGGLERAAAVAWTLIGQPIGRVKGVLRPAPAWAVIEAQHADGRPALSVGADAGGRYELPLPAGSYRLVMSTPGGERAESIRVTPGATTEATLVPPLAGTWRYSVTDDEGRLIPARLIFRGVAPTKNPSFGPTESAEGAGNVVYTRSGDGQLELPEGRYRVSVTRGLEYSIDEREIDVKSGRADTLRAVLNRAVDTTGWLACDFHLHAAPSRDSTVSLEDRVVSLLAEGVEFAVATDHNHVTDYLPAIEAMGAEQKLAATSGVEITTQTWGHFNAFPYPTSAPLPAYANVEPPELFGNIRALAPGVVIQVNHPRLKGIGYYNRIELDTLTGEAETEGSSLDFDTVEVMNGIELASSKNADSNLKEWFEILNLGRRYTAVGNSDSHKLVGQWAGYPRTYVRVPEDHPSAVTAEQVTRALRAGQAVVSNGPFVLALAEGRAGPGDFVPAHNGKANLRVDVRAPPWMDVKRADVYVNGERVGSTPARITTDPVRVEWRTALRITKDSWIVVVARGERPLQNVMPNTQAIPFAFTNPIFVDADGDGVFRARAR